MKSTGKLSFEPSVGAQHPRVNSWSTLFKIDMRLLLIYFKVLELGIGHQSQEKMEVTGNGL